MVGRHQLAAQRLANPVTPCDGPSAFLVAARGQVLMAAHSRLESPVGPAPAGADRARLGPLALPYRLGTAASFEYTGFNGRALGDDVMDVMLSLRANSALGDGVAPDPARIHAGRLDRIRGDPARPGHTKKAGEHGQRVHLLGFPGGSEHVAAGQGPARIG